jgi:hypothetical protein
LSRLFVSSYQKPIESFAVQAKSAVLGRGTLDLIVFGCVSIIKSEDRFSRQAMKSVYAGAMGYSSAISSKLVFGWGYVEEAAVGLKYK